MIIISITIVVVIVITMYRCGLLMADYVLFEKKRWRCLRIGLCLLVRIREITNTNSNTNTNTNTNTKTNTNTTAPLACPHT